MGLIAILLARDIETFIKRIKNPILRVELIQKALNNIQLFNKLIILINGIIRVCLTKTSRL